VGVPYFLWPPCIADVDIIFLPCDFYLSSYFFFFSWPNLSGRWLDVYHTSTHGVALVHIKNACLKCAARSSLKIQDAKNRHLGTIAQLCRAISSQLRHVSTIGKKLVKHQYLLHSPHNMVNFGPITAENCWRVWGIPANFNGFRVLAALLHGTPAVGVSQTLRRWTEGATYIRQGGHHVGHWPTFLVLYVCTVRRSYARAVLGVVILSVTRVLCDYSEAHTGNIFIPYKRAILVFCHPTVVGGRRPLPPKMGDRSDPPPSKIVHVNRFPPVTSQQ